MNDSTEDLLINKLQAGVDIKAINLYQKTNADNDELEAAFYARQRFAYATLQA